MHNLTSYSERAYNSYYRKLGNERIELRKVLACIPEFIHPSNLGTLPPHPIRVWNKGVQIGLIGSSNKDRMASDALDRLF